MISSLSGYSIRQLERYFHEYLEQEPPEEALIDQSSLDEAYLLIDGLWFGRWFVMMVYRQSKNLTILRIAVAGKEVATKISKDLDYLKSVYRFTGVVSDGGTGIRKAVFSVFGHIPHQICLAHTHRQAANSIGRYSKDRRVRRLKRLADHLWLIESKEALIWWKSQLKEWIRENRDFLLNWRDNLIISPTGGLPIED